MREIHGTICQIAAGGETGRETSIATENEKKKRDGERERERKNLGKFVKHSSAYGRRPANKRRRAISGTLAVCF